MSDGQNKSDKKIEKHIFSSDRPITSADEDQLNRKKFSRELAQSISQWVEKDSLVLAIYGQWGDGKSSVKNLVKEVFEKAKKDAAPLVMEFSPWQWTGEDHITEAFFKEVANKLGKSDDESQRKIAKKLLDYAEYLELSNELVLKFKGIAEKILIMATGSAGLLAGLVSDEFRIWLIILTALLLVATLGLDEIIWALKWFGKWKNIGLKNQVNLEERKADLVKSLGGMKRTLVVIIDDIDRLSKNEIKSLFRIIKANADFPNIVYLTFFQRDIVEKSLNESDVYEGKEYLKKIIQVGFDLPKVPSSDIHKILFRELDKLLEESKLDQKFEQGRWNELFMGGLSSYFSNLRDVNRFISTFSFHLGILKNNEAYEVNFIDLVGLEVLRQFEPKVYESVYFAKKLMTSSSSSGGRNHEESANKKQMEEILNSSPEAKKESVKTIIKVLFPNAQWAWGSNYHYNVGDDEFVELRVNHEDRFNRYFSLFLPDEDIPQSDFEYALSITDNEDKLFAFLFKYYEQGRLPLFVKKFEAYKQTINKDHAVPFISAMLRLGDLLTDEHEGFFSISPVMHVRRIVHWYFKKQDFSDNKEDIYWKILDESKSVFLPIDLLWDEVTRREADRYPDSYIFSKTDPGKVKNLLLKRFAESKDKQEFKKNIHLPKMLFIWNQVQKDEAKKWFDEYIRDDTNLITFLIKLESKGFTSSGYETKTNYYIRLSWLKEFFEDLDGFFVRVKTLKNKAPMEEERVKRVFEDLVRTEDELRHPEKYKDRF